MYASVLRSETAGPAGPRRQRAEGRVRLAVARLGSATRAARVAEAGSLRVRMPRAAGPALEAVLVNTAGGIACGDRFTVDVDAGPGAQLVVTTPAAERAYRSDGANAELDVRMRLADGADVAWLPQETIVFDRARLRRRIEVDLAADARLLLSEAVVFGRAARGENVNEGYFEDRWRIRREGRIVHADTLRLDGPVAGLLDRPAIAGGARALATVLYVAPDAEGRRDGMRATLAEARVACAVSAWNGLLAARFLAHDAHALRADLVRFLEALRGCTMPRCWQS